MNKSVTLLAGSGTTGHVEYYEADKDEWTEADSLRVGRSAASACTIKGLDNIRDYTFYGKEARLVSHCDGFDWQVSVNCSCRAMNSMGGRWKD